MIRLLKQLLSPDTLPPHIHFHADDNGNAVWCDESACRPAQRPNSLLFPPIR